MTGKIIDFEKSRKKEEKKQVIQGKRFCPSLSPEERVSEKWRPLQPVHCKYLDYLEGTPFACAKCGNMMGVQCHKRPFVSYCSDCETEYQYTITPLGEKARVVISWDK